VRDHFHIPSSSFCACCQVQAYERTFFRSRGLLFAARRFIWRIRAYLRLHSMKLFLLIAAHGRFTTHDSERWTVIFAFYQPGRCSALALLNIIVFPISPTMRGLINDPQLLRLNFDGRTLYWPGFQYAPPN
jgi:hypothetical protein